MVAYGTEKPKVYLPRLVDERLQRLLSTFGVWRDPRKEGLGGGLAGLHDYRADGGGPSAAVDAENGRILRHGALPPAGREGRPSIVVRDILDRLPRPFQGRRAGDSRAIKLAPYRLVNDSTEESA